jgi:hypothetical protein
MVRRRPSVRLSVENTGVFYFSEDALLYVSIIHFFSISMLNGIVIINEVPIPF